MMTVPAVHAPAAVLSAVEDSSPTPRPRGERLSAIRPAMAS